jgi:hypothetical protein
VNENGEVSKAVRTKKTAKAYRILSERRSRNRVLYLCLLASALAHFFALVPVGIPWMARQSRLKPRAMKAVALRIIPRAVAAARPAAKGPPAPAVHAPSAPAPRKAAEKVYTREAEGGLARRRAEGGLGKFARTPAVRARDVILEKGTEARAWASQELAAYEEGLAHEEAGEVGFRRVIDLRASSDSQISRLMEHYKVGIGYGGRNVTDLNLRFTSVWLLTKGQIRNYLARHTVAGSRQILASLPPAVSDVELRESGEGAAQPYIKPTIAALAALLAAEEKYFSSTGAEPEELECLVFTPVWSYRGLGFTVARAEKNAVPQKGKQTAGIDVADGTVAQDAHR